jgi:hypothetical protein
MNMRILAVAALCLPLAACGGASLVDAGKPVSIGDGIQVDPQMRWTKLSAQSGILWTVDGMGLNELRFFLEVKPDRPLMRVPGATAKELPQYKKDMLPDDILDLTVSTLSKGGYEQVRGSNLRPVSFGSGKGFRFDLDFVSDSLTMKGVAIARQHADHLDLILFVAPTEYYFGRDTATVEKIFASLQAPA